MKKRLIATLVLVTLVIGLCGIIAEASDTTVSGYQVGYAKVDITPVYDEAFRKFAAEHYSAIEFPEELNFEINIGGEGKKTMTLRNNDPIPTSLQGNAHTDVRLNTGRQDDNGDGIVDNNDGVFATAIAITGPNEDDSKTVILMSTDLINSSASVTADVRKNLFTKYGITGDRVMIDGSHSHHAPGVSPTVKRGGDYATVYHLQAAWSQYLRTQLTQAAELAIADRAEATMSKGTIEAEKSESAQGNVGDYLNVIRKENKTNDAEKYKDVQYVTELTSTVPEEYKTDDNLIEGYNHYTWEKDGITYVGVPELYAEGVHYNGVRHDQSAWVEATRENAWNDVDKKNKLYYAYSFPKNKVDSAGSVGSAGLPGEYYYIPCTWDREAKEWLNAEEVEELGYATPDVFATGNNFNSNFALDGVGETKSSTKYIRLDPNCTPAERLTREYIENHLVDKNLVEFEPDDDPDYPKRPYITNEQGKKEYVYRFIDIWVAAQDQVMSEVDDTLMVLKFSFDEHNSKEENANKQKKPILLVNWRSHTNKNRKVSTDWKKEYTVRGFYDSFYKVSSDWINALRYGLEFQGYRVAYFSGASGNVNGTHTFAGWYIPVYNKEEKEENGKITYTYTEMKGTVLELDDVDKTVINVPGEPTRKATKADIGKCKESMEGQDVIDSGYLVADASHLKNAGAIYGTELAEVALELLSGTNSKYQMTTINNPTGGIRSLQSVYQNGVKEVSLVEFLAAGKHQARDIAGDNHDNNLSVAITFDVFYWEQEEDNPETAIIDEEFICSMLDEDGKPAQKVDENGQPKTTPQLDENGDQVLGEDGKPVMVPDCYTQDDIKAKYPNVEFDDTGKVIGCEKKEGRFTIAAYLHANSAITDYRNRNSAQPTKVELNAIMLCDEIAIITAPGELYDRYSDTAKWTEDGYTDITPGRNMWDELWSLPVLGEDTYGRPFYLGYCNASTSYMPSSITYDYNNIENEYAPDRAKGSYETQITSFPKGTGENVMNQFKRMLGMVNGNTANTQPGHCKYCGETVQWRKLSDWLDNSVALTTGHYYVDQADYVMTEQTLKAGTTVCLDLNGKTLLGSERAFDIEQGGVLNIQDSLGNGVLAGQGFKKDHGNGSAAYGGTVRVSGELNLYSGSLTLDRLSNYYKPSNGGVVYVSGQLNMYNGSIHNGESCWAGGTVYGYTSAEINLYGGSIFGGEQKYGGRLTVKKPILLANDASVDELYLWPNADTPYGEMLIIEGDYKGTSNIKTYASLDAGSCVGTAAEGASIAKATLTYVNNGELGIVLEGTQLLLQQKPVAQIVNMNGDLVENTYTSVADAIAACESPEMNTEAKLFMMTQRVVLLADAEELTAANTVVLDLNGHNISKLTAGEGATVYCMDSANTTAKLDAKQRIVIKEYHPDACGKISEVGENVVGVPAGAYMMGTTPVETNVYLPITEKDGTSYHAVELNIITASLRPEMGGIYFGAKFGGDEKVQAKVNTYGIAMAVKEIPTANNMETTSKYTVIQNAGDYLFGTKDHSSVQNILTNILRDSNSTATNRRNAATKIYARGYIETDDGYVFGCRKYISLQGFVEKVCVDYVDDDGNLTLTVDQMDPFIAMYNRFKKVMDYWEIDPLKNAADAAASATE